MRDHHEEFTAKGARVVVIGMGASETARRFKEKERLPFTVLVDKKRESYRMLGLKRGSPMEVMGPRVWGKGLKSVVRHGQGVPKEDPYQLGGAAIVKDGKLTLVHKAEDSADNLSAEALLEAI